LRAWHITSRLVDSVALWIPRLRPFKLTSVYPRWRSISRIDYSSAIWIHLRSHRDWPHHLCLHSHCLLLHAHHLRLHPNHLRLHAHNLGLHSHDLWLNAHHLRLHGVNWLLILHIANHLTVSDRLLHIRTVLLGILSRATHSISKTRTISSCCTPT
jgi:hypothetical protein